MTAVLVAVAIARLARLVVKDYVTRGVRDVVAGVDRDDLGNELVVARPTLHYLFSCPWCMSLYVGWPVAIPAGYWLDDLTGWPLAVTAALYVAAGSTAAGLLAMVERLLDAAADRLDR